MAAKNKDLRDCFTAYDCRGRLPDLSAWMSDAALKQIPIWKGTRFERGQVYFDLDNPDRGAFTATGDEGTPSDYTYVCMADVPEEVWVLLTTWRQPISEQEGDALAHEAEDLRIPEERSAAGDFQPPRRRA